MTFTELKYGVGILPNRPKLIKGCQELRRYNFSFKNIAAISATDRARSLLANWGIKEWRVYDESERTVKA